MKLINRSTVQLLLIWLLIVPPGFIYIFFTYYPEEINWLNVFLFAGFGFLTVYLPIMRFGRPILLVMCVTVPAFLMYGLMVEIIVMQLAILARFFITSKIPTLNRLLLNSTLFFLLSIGSAFVFNLIGGKIGSFEFWPLILAVFCYQLFHTIAKDLLFKLYWGSQKRELLDYTKGYLLNYAVVLVILPLSLTLYFLINYIGVGAFFLVGAPFLFIAYILGLYNDSEKINDNLKQAGKIGHGLSNNLTEEKVIDQFVQKVSEMFNAEYVYLFDHKDGWLESVRSYEAGEFVNVDFDRIPSGDGIIGSVLMENKPVIYSNREEWESESKDYTPEGIQSVLSVPITRNQKVEAVLFLSTANRDAFEEYQLKILDILCSYFTVSIEKARNVEASVMKSERCALTKLYNYTYIEERLELEMMKVNNGTLDELSVLMLDIDHFKSINDTYGHQSGNEILYSIARILESLAPKDGVVARYGGEEFVYLLPGLSKMEAKRFAEKIRQNVQHHLFQVNSDLGEDIPYLEVTITVSIGVSGAPEDTDEAKTLLRNADRSLFLGAKQAGRNRVAGYVR
ncbi:sensor domain-containing diguanylate cyclase [Sporosarcina sp. G11-34]|uniref:sensor domain-containing diguanylate cyclase n=1 Tax=Sporosarcina sp. G11-34 TaxID=2849605 RepID=UPI0022A94589|nr:diguanylate cyclase [Sporosarcina sp. G11-34]MCZ2259816.1 diguanylate cyclase [Sporosarcina sp. G11-34]